MLIFITNPSPFLPIVLLSALNQSTKRGRVVGQLIPPTVGDEEEGVATPQLRPLVAGE